MTQIKRISRVSFSEFDSSCQSQSVRGHETEKWHTFDQSTERRLVLKSSALRRVSGRVSGKSNCPRSADENKTHVKPAQTFLEERGEGVSYSENIDFLIPPSSARLWEQPSWILWDCCSNTLRDWMTILLPLFVAKLSCCLCRVGYWWWSGNSVIDDR